MFNLFKNKKTQSLTDFYNKVGKLAKEYGKDHWVVRATYCGIKNAILFDAYIPQLGWCTDCPTIDDALKALKDKWLHPKAEFPVKEVLINQ
jgi:hypothetical protein